MNLAIIESLDDAARRRLVRSCIRLVGPDEAEDLAHDALVCAAGTSPPVGVAGEAWVSGVARMLARRRWRAAAVRRRAEAALARDMEARGPVRDVDGLRRAIDALGADERRLLEDRHFRGLPVRRLAAEAGASPAATAMRLSRIRRQLRARIEHDRAPEASVWSRTAVWCVECGTHRLLSRSTPGDRVMFRCPGCQPHPDGAGSEYRLTNPTFGRLLGQLAQPAAILRRASEWAAEYYDAGLRAGQAPCTRCGQLTPMRRYDRGLVVPDRRHRFGLHLTCDRCGESVSSSISGLAASHPEVRAAVRRMGRVGALPVADGRVEDRDVLVAGFRALRAQARVEIVLDGTTLRPLAVHTRS